MKTSEKINGKLRFGPAGNSADFYAAGFKRTGQAPAFLDGLGLNAFEYSFGRGVSVGAATAEEIRAAFSKFDIALSCHAPYYINLNGAEDAKIKMSFDFIAQSLAALKSMGGARCVFHPGSLGKGENAAATEKIKANTESLLSYLDGLGLKDYTLCPETMGKLSQWGSAEEIIRLCALDARLLPCFDFGHINSRTKGGLKAYDDYKKITDLAADVLGDYKAKNFHVHFSKIQYGESGEIRHLTFDDKLYGPDFEPLAKVIYEYKLTPTVICESRETQSRDAVTMKEIYEAAAGV